MDIISRRQFVGATAGTIALLALNNQAFAKSEPVQGWETRRQVNPAIDNMRVVCAVNPAMITKAPTSWEMEQQNEVISVEQVDRTLDAMAVTLSQKTNPGDAWATIFQKPQDKTWSAVKVAIKVNCNSKNNGRLAVISKVCRQLNALGVPMANIIIYDGRSNAKGNYARFVNKGLPEGVIVSDANKALGGMTKIALPWHKTDTYACTADIANGKIDIIVNVANNKGCDPNFGKATLTLKNHAGTFNPLPLHFGGGMDYLLAFNKSRAIMGDKTPRQQLCIVDSLWGMVKGPFGVPEKQLDRLVMGTFAPSVDYLTATKIREPLLGATHNQITRFLTDFGYETKEAGDFIMASV